MGEEDGSATTAVVVGPGDEEVTVIRLPAGPPGLAAIEAVARARLLARRIGGHLEIRGEREGLGALAAFLGLAEVLGLEAVRQPELGEELGVEEVVQPRDPAG